MNVVGFGSCALSFGLALFGRPLERSSANADVQTPSTSPYELRLREVEGETLCSVRAMNVRVDVLLGDIAQRLSWKLVGLEKFVESKTALRVHLEDRPLHATLYTLLGAVGLRARIHADTIEVLADLGQDAQPNELADQAEVSLLRALKTFPDDPQAPRAEIALAEIQERRGNFDAAEGHYSFLAKTYPQSELVPKALLQSGLLLERAGRWSEAAAKFTALANSTLPHTHQVQARLELARSLAHGGDAREALFILDALDGLFPTTEAGDRRARAFVRARAQNGAGLAADALRSIDQANALGNDPASALEAMELRAVALEQVGRPAEAARAWLSFAEGSPAEGLQKKARDEALTNAARLALDARDDLAVLFIQKKARVAGSGRVDDIPAGIARERLGLQNENAPLESLTRAEELHASRLDHQACQTLDGVYREREKLDDASLMRLALAYGRALDADKGVDAAIAMLKDLVALVRDVESRRRVYVLAGELYEARERFDEAIEAYGGKL